MGLFRKSPERTPGEPFDHTANRKPDFILPSAEGQLGYPSDLLAEKPETPDKRRFFPRIPGLNRPPKTRKTHITVPSVEGQLGYPPDLMEELREIEEDKSVTFPNPTKE